jgi:hypothetical protein
LPAGQKNVAYGLQAERNSMQQHTDECKAPKAEPFSMWLTPDLIGGSSRSTMMGCGHYNHYKDKGKLHPARLRAKSSKMLS